jgi:guanylate kinase
MRFFYVTCLLAYRWISKHTNGMHKHRLKHRHCSLFCSNQRNNLDLIDFDLVNRTIKEWSRPMPSEYVKQPMCVSGPSGVGKNRLIRALLKDYSKFFQRVVTHTTRAPRHGEINGTHYYFVTKDEFSVLNASNFFLESAIVHNNSYGVSFQAWQSVVSEGKISILEVDVQGAQHIKATAQALGISPKCVFIAPPNLDVLRERLMFRYAQLFNDSTSCLH